MPLFTLVLDYGGGTYIAQVRAESVSGAVQALSMNSESPAHRYSQQLRDQLVSDTPTPISGLTNVWCLSTLFDSNLALFHIVQTSEVAKPETTKSG